MSGTTRTLSLRLLANTQDFSNKMRGAGKNTNTLSTKFKSMAKAGALAFAGLAAAAGAAATKIGMDAISAATDFEESLNKANVIFGESSDVIANWAETAASSFGQSSTQALAAASNFAGLGKAAGLQDGQLTTFAITLTELASDLASFNNTSVDDAITALGSALRGESEPIRKFNVLLNDAALKAKATEMGMYSGKGALDMQAKSLAAYQLILEQTTDAQGDYARTSDGLANSQRTLSALWQEINIDIGQALAPTFTKFVNWLKTDGVPGIETFIDVLTGGDGLADGFRLNGKLVDDFRDDSLSPTEKSFAELAKSIRELAKRFGELFAELEIDNPNGKFNKMVDSVTTLVDALTTLTDINLGNNGFDWGDLFKSPAFKVGEWLGNQFGNNASATNIVVNGAVDPGATARAVSNALNYAPLRGVSTGQVRPA